MNYDLKKPCPKCPFRTDIRPYLTPGRVEEFGQAEFACHCTTETVEDDHGNSDRVATDKSQHCAGMLIMLEKMQQPHQMMRICGRLGLYDPTALDMDAPVFDELDDMVEACMEEEERQDEERRARQE